MTGLRLNVLRPEALAVYKVLSSAEELEGITLMGGTALALQIGHRISLDFDFATFGDKLPTRNIDALIARLKTDGRNIRLITDSTMVSQHKINTGDDLLNQVRDYVLDGVKVTFFAHGKSQKQRDYYSQAGKIKIEGQHFDLLDLNALKITKTLVLADRVRSRDLFDLMVLMRDYDYSVKQAVGNIEDLGHNDDPEYYKAAMIGLIPLDKSDEGLNAVEVAITPDKMYAFFDERIAEYESRLAEDYFARKY